ncbi:Eukaryotic translation initiation factor 3 subunit B [Yarrowia sp. B02]|nr:Eukaryotic translation initiation factor 3 subunit B [Yarrowia sp. B02]
MTVEDYADIDFSDLEEKYAVNADEGFESFIVVDGAPVIPQAKQGALANVMKKFFGAVGKIKEDGIFIPFDEATGKSTGFVFIEYETGEMAAAAVKSFHNKQFDKNHKLLVNKLSEVEKYGMQYDTLSTETFVEPETEPFVEQGHLRSWLMDPQGRDQFVLHRADQVGVFWNKKGDVLEADVDRDRWTETQVYWSPTGTYLVSTHTQGVQLWGGPEWAPPIAKFQHPNVKMVQFSPCEKFLVTWSNIPLALPDDEERRKNIPFGPADEGKQIVVWNLETRLPVRTFAMPPEKKGASMSWPILKFSPDDKYAARMIPGEQLSIYETETMSLLDKKSVKAPGIVDFEWAPALVNLEGRQKAATESVLCYWTPEIGNQTARVVLMKASNKEVIRTRNLFNVADCKIHWQDQGRFLCVKVDRHTKSKKSTFTNLEFFRLCERGVPVEVMELKDTVTNLAWEPHGDRFVTISNSDSTTNYDGPLPANRHTLSFYALERHKGAQGTWKLIKAFDKKNCNSLFWSPNGRFLITVMIEGSNSIDLDFWDLDYEGDRKHGDKDLPANLHFLGSSEHYGISALEWDPSGRFVATWSSYWRHHTENGYKIWDFRGQLQREESIDRFKHFAWRPRPPTLLSKQQKKDIRNNLEEYSRKFEEIDAMEASEASRELIMLRKRLLEEWTAWRAQADKKLEDLGLVKPEPAESEYTTIEEIKEVVVEDKEEVCE